MRNISEKSGHKFTKDEQDIARAYALIHDVSHIPFGHTLEDEHNLFHRHDKGKRLLGMLEEEPLKTALAGLYEPIRLIVERESKKGDLDETSGLEKSYLADIVSGTIGADLLDYLRRDNLFTGLRREYDPRLLTTYFAIRESDNTLVLRLSKHKMMRLDAASDVINLLDMRYTLTEKVYYHHTKLAFGAVLAKAVRIAKDAEKLDEKLMCQMGDWDLLNYLAVGQGIPDQVKLLASRITPRHVYRRAFAFPRKSFGVTDEEFSDFVDKYRGQKELEELERGIAEMAQVPFTDVVVYCPTRRMQLKEAFVLAEVEGKTQPFVDSDVAGVAELYKKYKQLWTFYVFGYGESDEDIVRIGKAAQSILNRRNWLDPDDD